MENLFLLPINNITIIYCSTIKVAPLTMGQCLGN